MNDSRTVPPLEKDEVEEGLPPHATFDEIDKAVRSRPGHEPPKGPFTWGGEREELPTKD